MYIHSVHGGGERTCQPKGVWWSVKLCVGAGPQASQAQFNLLSLLNKFAISPTCSCWKVAVSSVFSF